PLRQTGAPVWIWGAGHVGRALVDVLAPLPDLSLTWIDDAPARFPAVIPPDVIALPAPDMPAAMARAPGDAHHLILTYSHDIDLALCHAALGHGFAGCGLIGSATKWARFRSRLAALGHSDAAILRIACPIGDPTLGKHPQAIAVGVAAKLLTALKTPAVAPSARAAPA
ncbi:MAG: XdhC family protein, partial [Pseudomonadota bacterium]